jgi:antitoxin VapB
MAFHVRDPIVDAKVRRFASTRGLGITEAIGVAVDEAERRQAEAKAERFAALQAISEQMAKLPKTGLVADKAFFDSLYEE